MSSPILPLSGINVIELAGLAPVPFCGMILADLGANVVIVDDPKNKHNNTGERDNSRIEKNKSRSNIFLDLKNSADMDYFLTKMLPNAHVFLDPFRPGVLSKSFGLTEEKIKKSNSSIIIASITGYGLNGSTKAGHDLNYLAESGVLNILNGKFPINLLGDFAAGSLLCVIGILASLFFIQQKDNLPVVVDVSMTDGLKYLTSWISDNRNTLFFQPWGSNVLDGGSHFYNVYESADNQLIAVGCIEPKFYKIFCSLFPFENEEQREYFMDNQLNIEEWPKLKSILRRVFLTKPASYWEEIYRNTDACVSIAINHPFDFTNVVPSISHLNKRSKL